MSRIPSMRSHGDADRNAVIAAKTVLLLLAVGINALEYLLPRIPFLPWLKPGLANIVTMIWIIRWGAADAIFFSIIRSWLTSFYFGFSLVSLVLSMSGGIAAACGMGVLWLLFGRRGWIGLIGLGIAGAVLHNTGQLCGIYVLLTASAVLWYQTPFMLLASLAFGTITGAVAHALLPVLTRKPKASPDWKSEPGSMPVLRLIAGGTLIAAGMLIASVTSPHLLGVCACAASALAFAGSGWKARALLFPLTRFWLLFVFVGVMYLFFSYGRTIAGVSFITYEGVRAALLQWLRLWTWLEFSVVLTHIGFNRVVLTAAARGVPFFRTTIFASLFALELFPPFIALCRRLASRGVRALRSGLASSIAAIFSEIEGMVARSALPERAAEGRAEGNQ